MSNWEFERKLGSLRHKKKPEEEEIFHNKIYLFNSQTIENNIKKLKESLMQKTHFLKKHETIDNLQRETKYKLITGSIQIKDRKLNKKYESSFSSDKKYEKYQDQIFNNHYVNQMNNLNQNNANFPIVTDHENWSENLIKNDHYLNLNNQESTDFNNNMKDLVPDYLKNRESPDRKTERSIKKESSIESFKSNINYPKKARNPRFLTSLDNTSPDNNNNDSYSQSAKIKLQKFSNKIAFKSRNLVNESTMKGNSDNNKSSTNFNNFNIDSANYDASKLNFLSVNKNNNNKIQTYEITEKINKSVNTTNIDAAEGREGEYLRNLVEKKRKNFMQNTLNRKRANEKNSFNYSKSDSDFKLQEGEILSELNLLEISCKKNSNNNTKKYNNKDLVDKNYFNNINNNNNYHSNINNVYYFEENLETEKNSSNSLNGQTKENSEELRKSKNLYAGKSKNHFSPGIKPTPLNRNLKEIELTNTLNSLENEIYENQNLDNKKLESLKLPRNNRKMTNNHLFSSTQYLLSNPNLITNTEINANLKSQIKFYNTLNNLRNFTAPEAEANLLLNYQEKNEKNSHFKNINKNTNILIKENYSNALNSLEYKSLNDQAEKETKNSLSNLNNDLSYIKKKNENKEKSELSNSINKNKNHEANKNKSSNLHSIRPEPNGKMNQNASELDRNLNYKSYPKMKITDRVALMSKGILKESYDVETDKIFSKIFTKNLEQILEMKKYPIRAAAVEKVNLHDERYEFGRKNSISKEITDLKEKVYFLKGTLDYVFPQFLIGKLKETLKKQKVSKIRNTLSKVTENNFNICENKGADNNNNNTNNSLTNFVGQRLKTLDNSKSFTQNKENGILIIDNIEKCSSNGNSKNEFFFPNINLNTNQINNINTNTNNNSNNTSSNLIINNHNVNDKNKNKNYSNVNSNYKYINSNNNFNSYNNINSLLFSGEFNLKETGAKLKKQGSNLPGFRSSSFNNRYNLNNLNKTKLISPETNSSLFNKFNNFKNLSKNTTTAGNTNNVFWNNSMSEINLLNQRKLIKKQILTKTLSIQNMNSFNN